MFRAVNPDEWRWLESLVPMLLAALVDDQRRIAWAQADPQRRGPEPEPIARPGVTSRKKRDQIKTDGISRAEMVRRLHARNGRI